MTDRSEDARQTPDSTHTPAHLNIDALFAPLFDIKMQKIEKAQQTASDLSEEKQPSEMDFNEFLQSIEREDEKLTLEAYAAPTEAIETEDTEDTETIKQEDQEDPQITLSALMESLSTPVTQSQNDYADQVSAAQETRMLEPIPTHQQRSTPLPLKTSQKTKASLTVVSGWSIASKRSTAIIVWTLILLLMIGSLWTYNALAAKEQTSSALTLLSDLSITSAPAPQATIDTLGILSPAATSRSTPHQTAPNIKKTATPRSVPIPTATSKSVTPVIAPTATPKPIATTQPKPTPTPIAPVGQTIWLKSSASGDYVQGSDCSTSSPMLADATQVQADEKFTVIANSDGTIDFQSVATGKYVSAKDDTTDTPLLSCVSALQGWEKFTWINLGSGTIALKASNGEYVKAALGKTNDPLYAMSASVVSRAIFTWGSAS